MNSNPTHLLITAIISFLYYLKYHFFKYQGVLAFQSVSIIIPRPFGLGNCKQHQHNTERASSQAQIKGPLKSSTAPCINVSNTSEPRIALSIGYHSTTMQMQTQVDQEQLSYEDEKSNIQNVNRNKPRVHQGTISAKRLSKAIKSCRNDWKSALQIIYDTYPILNKAKEYSYDDSKCNTEDDTINNDYDDDYVSLDARVISTAIDLLGRTNQPSKGMELLQDILRVYQYQLYKQGKDGHHHSQEVKRQNASTQLFTIYKSIIGMIGQTCSSQSSIKNTDGPHWKDGIIDFTNPSAENILQLLSVQIPQTCHQQPAIDLYHAAISALGRCKRIDLIRQLFLDMENSTEIEVLSNRVDRSVISNVIVEGEKRNDDAYQKDHHKWKFTLPQPDRMAYNTALTAAIRCKSCDESFHLIQRMKQQGIQPDLVSYNLVIAAIGKADSEGVIINETMLSYVKNFDPESFNDDRSHLKKDQEQDEDRDNVKRIPRYVLALELLQEMEKEISIKPSEATYDTIKSVCAKDGAWKALSKMMDLSSTKMNTTIATAAGNATTHSDTNIHRQSVIDSTQKQESNNTHEAMMTTITEAYLRDLKKLEKVGKGRNRWCKLGYYTNNPHSTANTSEKTSTPTTSLFYGVQIHRNPLQNGLSIVFHDETTLVKLGYLLIRNTVRSSPTSSNEGESEATSATPSKPAAAKLQLHSQLLGMYVEEDQRGRGLANIFCAIWLQMCLDVNALPQTEMINKPILSLILSKFGFVPVPVKNDYSGKCMEVELCNIKNIAMKTTQKPKWEAEFALYSPTCQPLEGCYNERILRQQRMITTKEKPYPQGHRIFVRTCFTHPITELITMKKNQNSPSKDINAMKSPNECISKDITQTRNELQESIDKVILGRFTNYGKIDSCTSRALLKRSLFGFLYPPDTETE